MVRIFHLFGAVVRNKLLFLSFFHLCGLWNCFFTLFIVQIWYLFLQFIYQKNKILSINKLFQGVLYVSSDIGYYNNAFINIYSIELFTDTSEFHAVFIIGSGRKQFILIFNIFNLVIVFVIIIFIIIRSVGNRAAC